LPDHITVN
jgi:hypothetical protein